jgi:hypothetical protein
LLTCLNDTFKTFVSNACYVPNFQRTTTGACLPCFIFSCALHPESVVGLGGLEPPASPLSGVRSNHLSYRPNVSRTSCRGGASRDRTDDPLLAKQVLSQLSYGPVIMTQTDRAWRDLSRMQVTCADARRNEIRLARKEVIQPHLPIRLPCYDFTPVIDHSVVSVPLAVRLPTSGAANSHGVTGGVYKARERIHRSNADLRLLAIPTSRSRVADSDPDWDRFSGIGSTSRYCNPLYRPL